MILKAIRCAGFRGIRDQLELEIPEGFVVLTGRNGSGKSSLCDAIEFALTGQIRRQAGDSERQERIEDYVWWRGSDRPEERFVSVVFSSDDSRELVVTRTPHGLEHPRSEDELLREFCVPGQAPPDAMHRLLSTALIRDEEITQLSVDLAERDRFRFVRAAIGETRLPTYIDRLNKASAAVSALKDDRVAKYEAARKKVTDLVERIAAARADLSQVEDLAEAAEALADSLGTDPDGEGLLPAAREKVVHLRSASERLRELAGELGELEARMRLEAVAKHAKLGSKLAAEIEAAAERLERCEADLQNLQSQLDEVAVGEGDLKAWAEMLELGEELGIRDEHCPLCGSIVGEDNFLSHITEARALIRRRSEALTKLAAERRELREQRTATEIALEDLRSRFESHERLMDATRERRTSIIAEAREMLTDEEDPTKTSLLARGEALRDQARRVERWAMLLESSAEVEDLELLQDRLRTAREEQAGLEKSVASANSAHEAAVSAYDAVRRIEREVIEERLAALGPLLEELYLRLKPHLDWSTVRYRLRGDVQKYLSLEIGDELNPRFMFSSGQRRAMGIAFLLASYFSGSWARLRTLILDDPVQHVDDFRALHLAEVLNGVRKHGRQVFCAAEDPELARLMARRLRGVRGDAGALVELEYEPGAGVRIKTFEAMRPIQGRILESAS